MSQASLSAAEPFHSIVPSTNRVLLSTQNVPISVPAPLPQPTVGYEVKQTPISQGHGLYEMRGVPRPPASNLAIGDYYR